MKSFRYLVALLFLYHQGLCSLELGVWDVEDISKENNYIGAVKNAFAGTKVNIRVKCKTNGNFNISIGYMIRRTPCWEEYLNLNNETYFKMYYDNPEMSYYNVTEREYIKSPEFETSCNEMINIHPYVGGTKTVEAAYEKLPEPQAYSSSSFLSSPPMSSSSSLAQTQNLNRQVREVGSLSPGDGAQPIYTIPKDGVYLLVVHVWSRVNTQHYSASVHLDLLSASPATYLSITDWPLLPFYAVMCGVYVLLAGAWLVLCSLHWREILRLQFWIGGVIFLGMVEKAMFTAEYNNIHNSGKTTQNMILAAEIASCAKRSIARILVIIVSLGYGIVKPRLGPTLHRVVIVGCVYFVLATIESVFRVIHPKNDPANKALLAAVPLAVIDASICWWVFSALVATTRQLRLRRNLVKLSVYKHFANTLVFSIISSIIFMLWSIKYHKVVDCLTQWRDLWVDDAFWHLLFSVILCVIMVLWRPSKNNQRYAFTPLLDRDEDYSSEEEEDDILYSDAWEGLKMRGRASYRSSSPDEGADPELDPLKWVEENIPDVDGALPIIDSEEEIETTKTEISKLH